MKKAILTKEISVSILEQRLTLKRGTNITIWNHKISSNKKVHATAIDRNNKTDICFEIPRDSYELLT